MAAASVLAGPGTAQAAGCLAWAGRYVAPLEAGSFNLTPTWVAVVAACDVWVVGSDTYSSGQGQRVTQTLAEHWTGGQRLTITPTPNPVPGPGNANVLTGVAAASANDVWAVGYSTQNGSPPTSHALILHWDGSNWAQVTAPPGSTQLVAVTAVSASDVWAARRWARICRPCPPSRRRTSGRLGT